MDQNDRLRLTGKRARLSDVAKLAGVSTATVSRALNEPSLLSSSTRDRVLASAAALNWIPNAAGRALASNRTHIAGAIIPTLDEEVFAAQVAGMQDTLAAHGITLFLGCCNYDPHEADRQVRAMLGRGVEALSVVGEAYPQEMFDALVRQDVPYVVTYGYRSDGPHDCIGFDNATAFKDTVDHLVALGHREFAIILQSRAGNDRAAARLSGIRRALRDHGFTVPRGRLHEGGRSIACGRQAMRAIMSEPGSRATAVICTNDNLAIGAVLEAAEMGIDVPGEVSVTGFDDLVLAGQIKPAITTSRVDNHAIGRAAAEYLLHRLKGGASYRQASVPVEFRQRQSTGPSPVPDRAHDGRDRPPERDRDSTSRR